MPAGALKVQIDVSMHLLQQLKSVSQKWTKSILSLVTLQLC